VSEERPTTGTGLWRRLALGAGPLKRSSDRLQFLARVLLACCLLMGLPTALAVASATHFEASAEAAAQAAERNQVDATLTEDAPDVSGSSGIAAPEPRADAVWTGPSGLQRAGRVPVPVGAEAGAVVPIWIDRDGEHTTGPLSDRDVAVRSAARGLLTYLSIASVAGGLFVAFRKALDRSRMRRWEADWAVVEPVWTRSVL
jgi:hypothetical protein